MKKLLVSTLLLFATLTACGGGSDSDSNTLDKNEGRLGSNKYSIRQGSIEGTEKEVKGEGTIAFTEAFKQVDLARHFALNFKLEDEKSLSLVVFADKDMKNGVEIVFTRKANTLEFHTTSNGTSIPAVVLKNVDASQEIKLIVDAHNNESNTHILVWPASAHKFCEHHALFNSEDDGETNGNGKGTFWGLHLKNAVVTSAQVGDAKHAH